MKQFFIFVLLGLSSITFAQSKADSIIISPSIPNVVVPQVDSSQIKRLDEVEERLSAFYTYNRRSHRLIYAGLGVSLVGVVVAQRASNAGSALLLPLAGSALSLVGTVIYLDSFKFLNFKPKRKLLKSMTYY